MKKFNALRLIVALLMTALITPHAFAQADPAPTLADLPAGEWATLTPEGDTLCGRGDPYQFFVRPAADHNTDKLMVYFQGGGACWNSLTCSTNGSTFDETVQPQEDEFGFYDGIFNFENPENPVADYNFVFLPYCSADVHIGDSIGVYGDDLQVYHYGVNNSRATLNWMYENFSTPQEIIVTGSSAGAYGAIYHAPAIIDQYPDAQITQLGDAGIGATPPGWSALQSWGIYDNMPAFVPADPDTFMINALYTASMEQYPNVVFSQFTNAKDSVQIQFYLLSGLDMRRPPRWDDVLTTQLTELQQYENFKSFISDGAMHTVLARPEFYTEVADSVRFRDWFAALINHEPIENVSCETCMQQPTAQ